MVTERVATLLVTIHACDEHGTRDDHHTVINELENKYLGVTNETINALKAALTATTIKPTG